MDDNSDFEPWPHFATKALHAGQAPEQWNAMEVVPPISLSTTYKLAAFGKEPEFEYSRCGNPTRNCTEACVAALENGKHGMLFSSGSSCTLAITHLLCSGDHIVSMNDVYGGTNKFFRKSVPAMGIETTFVDMTNIDAVKKAIRPNTKMLWIETPTNPMMQIVDIQAVCDVAHQHPSIFVVVDNTFATPYFQRPLDLGADMVMHSLTKYMNGHTDVLMGAAVTNDEHLHERLREIQWLLGPVPSSVDCFLVNRGLKTLHVRMKEHQANGMAVAKYLEADCRVDKVLHPGLPSHPQHESARKQMKGYSGMVSFYIKGGIREAGKFSMALKVFTFATSLGDCESLAQHPATMSHASVAKEERELLGITDNLIRLSVGLEDVEDLIADLDQALMAAVEE